MLYTIMTFYTDTNGERHPWAKPFAVAETEISDHRKAARALIASLLDEGQPNLPHSISLEMHDPTGEVIFAYLRPASGEG